MKVPFVLVVMVLIAVVGLTWIYAFIGLVMICRVLGWLVRGVCRLLKYIYVASQPPLDTQSIQYIYTAQSCDDVFPLFPMDSRVSDGIRCSLVTSTKPTPKPLPIYIANSTPIASIPKIPNRIKQYLTD